MELMGITEIATALNLSRQRADQLSRQVGFPKPLGEVAAGRIWRKSDVTKWIAEHRRAER